jgi:hypothetical protein
MKTYCRTTRSMSGASSCNSRVRILLRDGRRGAASFGGHVGPKLSEAQLAERRAEARAKRAARGPHLTRSA